MATVHDISQRLLNHAQKPGENEFLIADLKEASEKLSWTPAAENERLRMALLEISELHCGDQPASSLHSEEIWLRLHIGKMRAAALAALK